MLGSVVAKVSLDKVPVVVRICCPGRCTKNIVRNLSRCGLPILPVCRDHAGDIVLSEFSGIIDSTLDIYLVIRKVSGIHRQWLDNARVRRVRHRVITIVNGNIVHRFFLVSFKNTSVICIIRSHTIYTQPLCNKVTEIPIYRELSVKVLFLVGVESSAVDDLKSGAVKVVVADNSSALDAES